MADEGPSYLFASGSDRRPYVRRFFWMLLGTVASFGAWFALEEAKARGESVTELLNIGVFLAILVTGLLFLRAMINLIRAFYTTTEAVVVFDRGFIWERRGKDHKYSWQQVRTFRKGARVVRLFGRKLLVFGSNKIITRDDKTFKFKGKMGDPDEFAAVVQPLLERIGGTSISAALRNNKNVRLHPKLVINTRGLLVDTHKIPWSQVDVRHKGNTVEILRLNQKGKFKTVMRFNSNDIENVTGFLDVAEGLMQNHQRERFGIPG